MALGTCSRPSSTAPATDDGECLCLVPRIACPLACHCSRGSRGLGWWLCLVRAYTLLSVSVMSRIGSSERAVGHTATALQRQEYEFRIGCVGVSFSTYQKLGDSLGILAASLVSIPLQVMLCNAQVARGRDLCTRV